jgi:hypothetical protein
MYYLPIREDVTTIIIKRSASPYGMREAVVSLTLKYPWEM